MLEVEHDGWQLHQGLQQLARVQDGGSMELIPLIRGDEHGRLGSQDRLKDGSKQHAVLTAGRQSGESTWKRDACAVLAPTKANRLPTGSPAAVEAVVPL